jgi:hypothetical protein
LEFKSEHDISEKLRAAFANCARHFHVLAHNTQVLAQSAGILERVISTSANGAVGDEGVVSAGVFDAREWDAARVQVHEAQQRMAELEVKAREMAERYRIAKGDN